MARTLGRARKGAAVVGGVLLLALSTFVLLSLTPPPALARRILTASDWILIPHPGEKRTVHGAQKLVGMYLDYAIAGKMARTVAAQPDLQDDVARIVFVIDRAQHRMLSAGDVPHDPQDWPVLVSGVGYCDQVNAAVCRILSHSFRHAQLYGFYDPQEKLSPHVVGRVWSDQRQEWLYFDAYPNRPIVFRKLVQDEIEILSDPGLRRPNRSSIPMWVYNLRGWVINEYPPTFPMYVVSRLTRGLRPRSESDRLLAQAAAQSQWGSAPSPAPAPAAPGVAVTAASTAAPSPAVGTPAAPPPVPRLSANELSRAYVRARAEDLFGRSELAKSEYRTVANAEVEADPLTAVLQDAAKHFADQ